MYDKKFEVVGLNTSPDGVYTTLYVLQTDESIKDNNSRTSGRMALNIPMKTDPKYPIEVGDTVKVGFSTKYKKFYVMKGDSKK